MKKNIIIAIVSIFVIITIGTVYFNLSSKNENKNKAEPTYLKESQIEVGTQKTDGFTNESSQTPTKKLVSVEKGYISYDKSKLNNAQYGKVVLFFHASWCPSCKGLDTDIKNNLDKIPEGFLILKVDYDTSTELKSKYKINTQHTLVQVDQDGKEIKSSKGLYQLNTLESVISNFK